MTDLLTCPFCDARAEVVPVGGSPGYWVKCSGCGAEGPERMDRGRSAECWNTRAVPAQGAVNLLPDRERMAEILYTAAHKGLSNCWKWSDADLDHEHPASRGYWYKIADGTLSALSSTQSGDGK